MSKITLIAITNTYLKGKSTNVNIIYIRNQIILKQNDTITQISKFIKQCRIESVEASWICFYLISSNGIFS